MGVMEKLKIFVVKEPVVAASCLIAGFGTRPLSSLRCTRTLADGIYTGSRPTEGAIAALDAWVGPGLLR
jgi:hypothetical protein